MIDPRQPDYLDTPAGPRRAALGYLPEDPGAPPRVSVITPYFNTGPIVHETAQALLRQSLQQWEWVIVNDGSSDAGALAVLAEYRGRDPRMRVIDLPANKGLSAARNAGVRAARGEILFFLDADDLVEPTALEKGAWFLDTWPELAFANSWSVGFGASNYLWSIGFERGREFLTANQVTAQVFVRRAAHEVIGGFAESLRHGMEDWDYWLRMAEKGLWGATIPEYLTWYRRREDHGDRWPELSAQARAAEFLERCLERCPNLRAGRFPEPAARDVRPFEPVRPPLPGFNRLARSGPRVLMILPWLELGGADKFNLDLIAQLRQRGWGCTIATTKPADNRWTTPFSRQTADIFHLPSFVRLSDQPAFLVHLIQSRRPDVVLVSNSELGYWLLPYLRAQCPDPAYVDYTHMEQEDWKNGGYPRYSLGSQDQLDLSIVASRHLRDWMVARGGPAGDIQVCPINVDTEYWSANAPARETARAALGLSGAATVIVFTGRLCPQKQPKVLGHTFQELARRELDFVALVGGDGPDADWLREFLEASGLGGRVRLMGALSSEQVRELYRAGDIFFLPSQWEGIALSVYEAMAAGLPIVGADVGGQKELVTDACGFLLPRGDLDGEVQRYADVLQRLARDKTARQKLGRAGAERIAREFSLPVMGARMVELFGLARERRRAGRSRLTIPFATELATRAIEFARVEGAFDKYWIEGEAIRASYDELQRRFASLEHRLVDLHTWTDELDSLYAQSNAERERLQARSSNGASGSAWRRLQADYRKLHAWTETLSQRHDEANRRRQLAEAELNGIRDSTGWRVLQILYRVRHALFPRGSRREKLGKAGMQALRGVRRSLRQGPTARDELRATAASRAIAGETSRQGLDVAGLVSVVLPVYNQADLLGPAIESVLAQTYQPFELIIVDDGSRDAIEDVLRRYASDARVRVLRQANQKLPAALNAGFAFARGEFLTWTSADNLMGPRQLERQVAFLRANPATAMVYCDYVAIDDRGQPLRDPAWRAHNRPVPDSAEIRLPRSTEQLNTVADNFIGPCFMYRAAAARLIGDYAPRMGYEDYDYWMRMNTFFPMAHLGTDELLYRYRVHDNTLSARAGELKIEEGVRALLRQERQRQQDYRAPWTIFADEGTLRRLEGVSVGANRLTACKWPLVRPQQADPKRLLLLGRAGLRMLESQSPPEGTIVAAWLPDDATAPCDCRIALAQRVDLCFVGAESDAARAALFHPGVVQASSAEQVLRLTLAAAENRVQFRSCYGGEPSRPALPDPLLLTRPARILLQVEQFVQGGLEQVVFDLALALKRQKLDVTVLVLKDQGLAADRALAAGIEIVQAPASDVENSYRKLLLERKIDLVNAHGSLLGAPIAQELKVPFVQTIHNAYAWLNDAGVDQYRAADAFTCAYTCVSANCALYADVRMGLPVGKMIVVPNGVELRREFDPQRASARAEIRSSLGLKPDDFVFLNVASLYPPKAQLAAVRALAQVSREMPQARLVFLGRVMDAAYEQRVRAEIERLGLCAAIVFAGFQSDAGPFYDAADAFVLPSFWEGWSLALAEAILAGLPVVASDVGAARELLWEVGGELVAPPFEHAAQLSADTIGQYLSCEDAAYLERLAAAMMRVARAQPPRVDERLRRRLSRERAYESYGRIFRWLLQGGDAVAARTWTHSRMELGEPVETSVAATVPA